jgi:hypothetical protein
MVEVAGCELEPGAADEGVLPGAPGVVWLAAGAAA